MSRQNVHTEQDSIPEGLEFRQEYLDAALGAYKRTKRIILWKRVGYVGITAAILLGAVVAFNRMNETPVTENKTTEEVQLPNLEKNENSPAPIESDRSVSDIKEHGPSPAVESLEATQDRSSRATDLGNPTSSGEGLPGQLSNKSSKVTTTTRGLLQQTRNYSETAITSDFENAEVDLSQQKENTINLEAPRLEVPYGLTTRLTCLLSSEQSLATSHPSLAIPQRPMSIYACLGIKLWADYGFNQRPMKPDALIGLGINYAFNRTISADIQAQFTTISGLANPYTVVQQVYGTGFNETTYRYYTDRMYECGAAARVNYRIGEKHGVSLGFVEHYLLTTDNRIETGVSSSFENPSSVSQKTTGYSQGFRSLQHGIILGYEYALGKSKSIGAQYQLGLTDVTKDRYFGETYDRNSMLSLYFRIKLYP